MVQKSSKGATFAYKTPNSLWERYVSSEGFSWWVGNDGAGNTLAFVRWNDKRKAVVAITNFSPVPQDRYHLPMPATGTWIEILNTDDLKYGGSGIINGQVIANAEPLHGYVASATLRLPPLATIWLAQD